MKYFSIFTHMPKIAAMISLMLTSVMANAQIGGYTFVQQSSATTSATAPCTTNNFTWTANSMGCNMYSTSLCSGNPYVAEASINLPEATSLKVESTAYVCLTTNCDITNLNLDIYIDGVYVGNCNWMSPSTIYYVNLSAGPHTVRYQYNGNGGASIGVMLSYRASTLSVGSQYTDADGKVKCNVSSGGSIVMEGLSAEDEVVLSDAMGRTEHHSNASFTTSLRGIVSVMVVSPQKDFRQKILVIE